MQPSKIKIQRNKMNLSRAELSRLADVPRRTLEAWEYGTRLPRDVYQLAKIAKVLKCQIEDLIYVE